MLNTKSLVDQIYDTLLLRIRNLEYKPGTKFNLDKLKIEFSVSTAPIREALQRLARDNIVVVKPRIGFNVAHLTKEDIENVFEARKLLEGFCLRMAIQKEDSESLVAIHKRMLDLQQRLQHEDPPPGDLVKECIDIDDFFHKDIIVNNCNNIFILKFYETLNNFSSIIRHYSFRLNKDITQHISIVEAMLESDFSKAERKLLTHLEDAKTDTIEWISKVTRKAQPLG
ncbi:MAG: GntR family transcriptional regulator [Spirochaetes bacterium]|nr:GntR family transcriptional regulator [Spirochaetota bacterium]